MSCLPAAGGNTTCYAGGVAFPSGFSQAESVALVSHDDVATWGQIGGFTDNGWLSSISCASTQNCWAGGAGSADALVGTSNGGTSWSTVTSDTTNEEGSVSCLDISTCAAVTDGGLWVTHDDGGLTPAG